MTRAAPRSPTTHSRGARVLRSAPRAIGLALLVLLANPAHDDVGGEALRTVTAEGIQSNSFYNTTPVPLGFRLTA